MNTDIMMFMAQLEWKKFVDPLPPNEQFLVRKLQIMGQLGCFSCAKIATCPIVDNYMEKYASSSNEALESAVLGKYTSELYPDLLNSVDVDDATLETCRAERKVVDDTAED